MSNIFFINKSNKSIKNTISKNKKTLNKYYIMTILTWNDMDLVGSKKDPRKGIPLSIDKKTVHRKNNFSNPFCHIAAAWNDLKRGCTFSWASLLASRTHWTDWCISRVWQEPIWFFLFGRCLFLEIKDLPNQGFPNKNWNHWIGIDG